MEEEPLLPLSTPIPSNQSLAAAAAAPTRPRSTSPLLRVLSVAVLFFLTLWANYEASKGFDVLIRNDAGAATMTGKWFNLILVSNGHAARLVSESSMSIEQALFPDAAAYPRKTVDRVTVHLLEFNLSTLVKVRGDDDQGRSDRYVLYISASVATSVDARAAAAEAIYRGMARVWLWDGRGTAPESFLEAMVEQLVSTAGFTRPAGPAGGGSFTGLLQSCQGQSRGCMARLNRAMRDGWVGERMEMKLGSAAQPSRELCEAYCGLDEPEEVAVRPAGSELRQTM